MIKILRRIIFFSFLAAFLIGAPKIVFYALGYTYQSGSDKGIIKTGLVYLSTAPPGATVYVGGRRYHEPTPAIIRDLLPGNYPIRLVLKDYEIWTQTIPVEAAKASVLGKILMHPKKPEWHMRAPGKFEELIAIPDTRYLLLKKSNHLNEIQVYDWKEKKIEPLFPENISKKMRLLNFYSVRGSAHILLKVSESGKNPEWIWLDLDKKDRDQVVWSENFPVNPEKIMWPAKDPDYLFVFEKNAIIRFDPKKKISTPILGDFHGYGVDEHKLFLLTAENHFVNTDFLDKSRKLFLPASESFQALFPSKDFFEIQHFSDEAIFFLSKEGKLLVSHHSRPIAESGILNFHFDKKHRRAVIWTNESIGMLKFPKEKKEQEAAKRVEWILRQAKKIQNVFWAHDGAYLIFQDQNKVFLLELETFGSPSVYELLETQAGARVFYTDESGELFYLDKKTGDLMSLEVVPKWKVLEVPFSILQEKEKEGKAAA